MTANQQSHNERRINVGEVYDREPAIAQRAEN